MARIRTLKPEIWSDEKLAPQSPLTRLVFVGLISNADDAGRLVDNVKSLDGQIFPETDDTCREALQALADIGRILRYTTPGGQRLIQITHWFRHQKVDKPSKHVLSPPPRDAIPDDAWELSESVARDSRGSRVPTLDRGPGILDLGPGTGGPGPAGASDGEFSTGRGELAPAPPVESLRDGNSTEAENLVLDALVAAGVPTAAREGERPIVVRLLAAGPWDAPTLATAAASLPRHKAVTERGKPVGAYLLAWEGMVGECLQLVEPGAGASAGDDPPQLGDPAVGEWFERIRKRQTDEADKALRTKLIEVKTSLRSSMSERAKEHRWPTHRTEREIELRVARWYGQTVGDPMPMCASP